MWDKLKAILCKKWLCFESKKWLFFVFQVSLRLQESDVEHALQDTTLLSSILEGGIARWNMKIKQDIKRTFLLKALQFGFMQVVLV